MYLETNGLLKMCNLRNSALACNVVFRKNDQIMLLWWKIFCNSPTNAQKSVHGCIFFCAA